MLCCFTSFRWGGESLRGWGSPSLYILAGGSSIPSHPFGGDPPSLLILALGGVLPCLRILAGGEGRSASPFCCIPPSFASVPGGGGLSSIPSHPCFGKGLSKLPLILAWGSLHFAAIHGLAGGPSTFCTFAWRGAGGVRLLRTFPWRGEGSGQRLAHWHRGTPGLAAPSQRWRGGVCAVTSHSCVEREGDPAALHLARGRGGGGGASPAILGREDPSSAHHCGGYAGPTLAVLPQPAQGRAHHPWLGNWGGPGGLCRPM